MARRKKRSDKGKSRPVHPRMRAFMEAAKAEGFMKKGEKFKPLPKKGTAAYKRIMKRMK